MNYLHRAAIPKLELNNQAHVMAYNIQHTKCDPPVRDSIQYKPHKVYPPVRDGIQYTTHQVYPPVRPCPWAGPPPSPCSWRPGPAPRCSSSAWTAGCCSSGRGARLSQSAPCFWVWSWRGRPPGFRAAGTQRTFARTRSGPEVDISTRKERFYYHSALSAPLILDVLSCNVS